ncbi:hypothetical protein ESCO_005371 [Escovopsis weberi]|uniref:Uncharacterized protein n=1 Tax=Escovopsis weberi TaxID=150374 RepID=A0A0M8MX44_ESCWE|nr:hypothetical protein ESCO_005371 [Escovopsis weberi]
MAPPKAQNSPSTFKYKSLDHISLLNYQVPSKGSGLRPALEFYGGASTGSSAPKADLRSEIMTPTSDVMSSLDDSEKTPDGWSFWSRDDMDRNGAKDNSALQKTQVAADTTTDEITISGRAAEQLYQLEALKLAECRRSLAFAQEELAMAHKSIDLMRKHNANFAQELAAAESVEWVQTSKGQWPGLVHVGSVPLLTTRIEFPQMFDYPPQCTPSW